MSQNRPTISAFLEARKVKTAIAAIALCVPALLSAGTPDHDAIGFIAEHYKEIKCLARVIYHETRGESHAGKLGVAAVAINANFNVSCVAAPTATAYTLQAVGVGAMAGFTFTVNQDGTRTSTVTGAPAGRGWAGNAACWISNKGGAC